MNAEQRLTARDLLLLVLFAAAIFLPGISSIPPVDRDESRYAVATTQMVESGNLVDIRFQDQPRYLQPAGIYWLQAASASLFGAADDRAIWAYRVPSFLGALAAVLLTGLIGASAFGRRAGLGAALLLASCLSLGFEARIAKIDATLLGVVAAAQFALMALYVGRTSRPRLTAALFWAALGVGVMLKGPIILIVSGGTVLGLLLWDRRVDWLARLHAVWGVPLMLAVVLPWLIAIGIASEGEFFARAVGKNLLGKVATGEQAHGAPPGYHLTAFTLMFWPGSLFAVLAAPFVWRNRARSEIRFLVAWIVPVWLVFELVATKLPHYVLPTYPAIACLAAVALFAPRAAPAGRGWRVAGVVYAVLWTVAGLLLALIPPLGLYDQEHVISPLAVAISILSVGLIGLTLWSVATGAAVRALGFAVTAALTVWINAFAVAIPSMTSMWMSPRIMQAVHAAAPCPGALLITTPYHEPSLVFLNGSRRTLLAKKPEEAAEALAANRACGLALVGRKEQDVFMARAHELGVQPEKRGLVAGRNYSDGRKLELTLYAAGPAADTRPAARP